MKNPQYNCCCDLKLHVILFFGFFKIHFIPTGIPSVFTDINILFVNTDRNGDGNNSVNKYHVKMPTKYFHGNFICIRRFSCNKPS